MTAVIVALLVGIGCGAVSFLPKGITNMATKLTLVGVVALIASMGAKIGMDPDLIANFAVFGGQALFFAICAVVGSVLGVIALEKLLVTARETAVESNEQTLVSMLHLEESAQQRVSYTMTVLIIGSLVAGIMLGYWLLPKSMGQILSTVTNWALYFTIWAVGLDLGKSRETFGKVLTVGWRVFLAPLGVALGSIIGAMLGGLLMGFPINESSAIGAGFGWYSLSGVLLSQIYNVKIGTIAFLSNVFRELIAVMIIPVLAKRVGTLAAVAPGGATTMDTTLPIIAASAGSRAALIGFVNGLCLSSIVPFLLPLLIKL